MPKRIIHKPPRLRNPFEYGRELAPDEMVDRTEEVRTATNVMLDRGKLFLIGPRRYGKTSILKVAARKAAEDGGAVVLRYDAEAYPRLDLLAQRIVADAAKALLGTIERATERAARFFGRLRPHLTYNTADGTFSASLQVADDGPRGDSGASCPWSRRRRSTGSWTQLTAVQQTALIAFVREWGEGLASAAVARRYATTTPSLQTALEALRAKSMLRDEEAFGTVRLRLVDPFFGAWIALFAGR